MDGAEILASDVDAEVATDQPRRTWWLLLSGAAWTLWALALAWFVLHAAYVVATVGGCPPYLGDNSSAGDPGWQWIPPGITCSYYANENAPPVVVVTPDFSLALLAILLVAMPVAAIARRRTHRHS